jgi:hypothetical protein
VFYSFQKLFSLVSPELFDLFTFHLLAYPFRNDSSAPFARPPLQSNNALLLSCNVCNYFFNSCPLQRSHPHTLIHSIAALLVAPLLQLCGILLICTTVVTPNSPNAATMYHSIDMRHCCYSQHSVSFTSYNNHSFVMSSYLPSPCHSWDDQDAKLAIRVLR